MQFSTILAPIVSRRKSSEERFFTTKGCMDYLAETLQLYFK